MAGTRMKQAPPRKTSPPAKELTKTSSSGAGMSNGSPYISCRSITIGCGTPAAIGWVGATVHTAREVEPDASATEAYDELYPRWRALNDHMLDAADKGLAPYMWTGAGAAAPVATQAT